jgi:DNA-binding transcriptional ArsR family regulator
MDDKNQLKNLYGYLLSSKVRKRILEVLQTKKALPPKDISKNINNTQQNISKELINLTKKGLIECITPAQKRWTIYMITKLGREVLQYDKKLEEEIKKRKN